jgi:O-antigen/teichoic acid export membrane protein
MKDLSSKAKNDKYFCTDHLKDDLKKRSVRGGTVTMIAQLVKFSLNLGSNVLLARLLTPQDYGLIGMVTAVTGFVTLFKDLGLSMATVQQEEINHEQVSNLFWVNVTLGVVTGLITIGIAPGIASFYQEPRLIWITIALASGFIMGSLGVQHSALLNRQMQFKTLVINDILSMSIGVVAAIVAAFYGLSYWALVIMPLTTAVTSTIGVWLACSWRPGLPLRRSGTRTMLAFGSNLTGFSIVNYFARNLDNVLIGRVWGAQQLGLYAKAYQLLLMPISQINAPIAAVAVPSLSRLQKDPEKFRHHYLKALSVIAFLTMPIITLMIVTSEEIIELTLGSQWREAATIFRLLAISAIVQPICNTTGWLYISTGKTNQMFKWGLFASPFIVLSFFIGLPYGAKGVAFSYAIAMILQALPCMYFAIKGTNITVLNLLQALKEQFLSALIAGIVVFGLKIAISSYAPVWMTMFVCSVVMSMVYVFLIFYVFKMKAFYLGFLRELKK